MRDIREWELSLNNEFKQWLDIARAEIEENSFRSLSIYLHLLKELPVDEHQCIRDESINCLNRCLKIDTNYCIQLDIANKVYEFYPDNSDVCLFYARYLFAKDQILQSIQIYQKAIELSDSTNNKTRLRIEAENVRSYLFDQWHFPMLNDEIRNSQFKLAIEKCIEQLLESTEHKNKHIHVVDLGCGTGILATFIARELQRRSHPSFLVSAIDSNSTMIYVANEVFSRNNVSVESHCLDSAKFQSTIPINLVVSETLDCAIFGERFISSLLDLHTRLGSTECFKVLPSKVTFYLALYESSVVKNQHFCKKNDKRVLLSNECYLNWPIEMEDGLNDPYDSLNLDDLKEARILSEPIEAFTVDFNDFEYLRNVVLANKLYKKITLTANKRGEASCVVGWFRLELFKNIYIDTKPGVKTCWPHAIFPFYPPVDLVSGSHLDFQLCVNDEKLYVCPINLPEVTCRKTRLGKETNFPALNSQHIQNFFQSSIEELKLRDVIDMTDLLINEPSNFDCNFMTIEKYLTNQEERTNPIAILQWPFNSLGCFDTSRIEMLIEFVKRFDVENVQFVPYSFKLKGMLVKSDQLKHKSSLVPNEKRHETYCGVDISSMQEFYIRHFHELDLNQLEFEQASDSITLFEMDFKKFILQYDEVHKNTSVLKLKTSPCRSNALLYWFELFSEKGSTFDMRQLRSSTSAYLFGSDMELKEIDTPNIITSLSNCEFYFEFS